MNETKKKRWCPNSAIDPQHHFYSDPAPYNTKALVPPLENAQWVCLIAPSQSGKTTRTLALRNQLNTQGFNAIYIDLQGLVGKVILHYQGKIEQPFLEEVLRHTDPAQPLAKRATMDEVFDIANSSCFGGKEVILLFDDIDALANLPGEERMAFLACLRALKAQRASAPNTTLLLSALAITNHVGNYLLDTLGQSPFNVARPIEAPFLTEEEHMALYKQYEQQEQPMDPRVKQQIFKETGGAQGLEQLVGLFYDEKFQAKKAPLSITEWLNYVYSTELLDFVAAYPNFQKMTLFLSNDDELARACCAFLAAMASSCAVLSADTTRESAELLRKNILRRTSSNQLAFASPLVRHFVLSRLVQTSPPLSELPLSAVDQGAVLDIPKLVLEVVKAMNPLEIASAKRKKNNPASIIREGKARHPPGPKEATYVQQFTSTLLQITSAFSASLKVESEVPVELAKISTCPWPAGFTRPSKELSCDMLLTLGTERVVIEHAANVSLNLESRDTASLVCHIEAQARQYKRALDANQAWVIDWTTVPPSHVAYHFTSEDKAVSVIYVYHDEPFRHIEVHWAGGTETVDIEPKLTWGKDLKRKRGDIDTIDLQVILVDAETGISKPLLITSYDLAEIKQGVQKRFGESREVDELTYKIVDTVFPLQEGEDVKQLKDGTKVFVTWAVNLFGF